MRLTWTLSRFQSLENPWRFLGGGGEEVAAREASDLNLAPGGAHPAQLWTTAQLGDRLFLEPLWVGLMDSRLGKERQARI